MVRACLARRGLNMTIDLSSAAASTRRTFDNPAHQAACVSGVHLPDGAEVFTLTL